MLRRRSGRYRRFGWILLGLALLCTASAALCAEQGARVGTLHIRGHGIELLVLQDGTGHQKTLQRPETDVVLPEGRYRIEQVILRGGQSCRPGEVPAAFWLVVDPNTPATLSVGAPLQQVIKVSRRGSIMDLAYELVGQGGEHYSINRDRQGPSFAVYRGDHKVTSGDFAFG